MDDSDVLPLKDDTTEGRRVAAGFESEARSIGALRGSARGARNVRRRLEAMARLGDLGGSRLLDVGCGTGEYTREFAEIYNEVDGIDIELDRLAIFEADHPDNVAVKAMSITDAEYADSSFDAVTMIEVLEHLADIPASMREIARILRPAGALYLTTPNRWWPFEQHGVPIGSKRYGGYLFPGLTWVKPLHRRLSNCGAFTRRDLEQIAADAGLELTGVTYMMPPLDSLEDGHMLHRLTEALERPPFGTCSQTIIARMVKPAR